MSLSVIGAGFGRTGTLSLKLALEQLGHGPCYHMVEVFGRPEHVELWRGAGRDGSTDWETLFAGFTATVDWPGCTFWRQLASHYPAARVLLTTRDAESWYQSVAATIYEALVRPLEDPSPRTAAHRAMVHEIVLDGTFDGRFSDRRHAIAVYERHNEAVRRAVAPERLLVFEVAAGWDPLCRFLDRDVPETPFPAVNSTAEFRDRFQLDRS